MAIGLWDRERRIDVKIRIPDIEGNTNYIENKKSVVLIGANGAGKTRMSIWIDENNPEINIHRISAQKSLNLPQMVSPTEIQMAEEEFLYGTTNDNKYWLKQYGKKSSRWGNSPETYLLNDYDKLMRLLMTENYEKSIEYREKHKNGNEEFDNDTRLEKIKEIWEDVILHRKIKICAGKIETSNRNEDDYYNGCEMSDGERAIFYFIGEVLCAKENSLIIIDEPENHLHKSILVRLWNAIECSRPDCMFLYITHNLDFASSRINSQIIWVKEFFAEDGWRYDLLDDINSSDSLKLEIMGNRQKVLLVEGTASKSIDRKLYSKVYPEFNIIPMESCNAVIQTTKAYNQTNNLHYEEVKGIIDRDRRDEEEITKLKEKNIFVPKVAEIENLFLITDVIRIVAEKQDKSEIEQIISEVQDKTFEFLTCKIEEQALLFTKQKSQNYMVKKINEQVSTIEEYKTKLSELISLDDLQSMYDQELEKINKIIEERNYLAALKVINNKGLLPYTQLPNKFGWKKDYYIDYVLLLLEKKDSVGNRLKQIFRQYIAEL
jgi:ABC-type cobalamin/Fe3+-siderophores transport system ATPase subunit